MEAKVTERCGIDATMQSALGDARGWTAYVVMSIELGHLVIDALRKL